MQVAEQELKPQLTVTLQDMPPVAHSTLHGPLSLQFRTEFLQLSMFGHFMVHLCPGGHWKVVDSHPPVPLQSMTQSDPAAQVTVPIPLHSSAPSHVNTHKPGLGLDHLESAGQVPSPVAGTETPHSHCPSLLHNCPSIEQSSVPSETVLHIPFELAKLQL